MSTNNSMLLIVLISPILCIIRNSWIIVWIALELNTLSFCRLIKYKEKIDTRALMEIRIKYFIIQSISSTILVFSIIMTKEYTNRSVFWLLGLASILIKAASSPFHQWFISIIKKSKWTNSLLLITYQKLAPVYLLLFQRKILTIPFIILSILLGSMLQLNKTKVMEILALSSIFNLGWIILRIIFNTLLFFVFSTLYWISVLFVILIIKINTQRTINRLEFMYSKKWINLLIMANLAGIPPLTGFLAKWMVLKERILTTLIVLTSGFLIVRAINFYVYLRMFAPIFLKTNKIKYNKNQTKKSLAMLIILNLFPLTLIVILGLAWKRTILIR